MALRIDRARSADRIARDVDTLGGPADTTSTTAVCRYAYTPAYERTLGYLTGELAAIDFTVERDPVGTLVGRNRPPGERSFGIGSHCDSNRNGGKYDGTLGVAIAIEVARLARESRADLPLTVVAFLEEEGSGFGQILLGSRIVTGRVTDEDLRERIRALDDGRSFWAHAEAAGYAPTRWREAARLLDGLLAWVEPHIEQGPVLDGTGRRLGIVPAIAGFVHADLTFLGRADHAGAAPMDRRHDALVAAAACVLEVERRAIAEGVVGTVGEIEVAPGRINVVPERVRLSLDVRGVEDARVRSVVAAVERVAAEEAARRGLRAELTRRQEQAAVQLDARVVGALEAAARATGEPHAVLPSGAAHDTMLLADRVPCGMLFVPCRDGVSHSPAESADPADAALAAEVVVNALLALV